MTLTLLYGSVHLAMMADHQNVVVPLTKAAHVQLEQEKAILSGKIMTATDMETPNIA